MFSFQQDVEVPADRRIVIELPPEVPVGPARLTLSSPPDSSPKPSSLAAWARENAEDLGANIRSTDVEGFTGRSF